MTDTEKEMERLVMGMLVWWRGCGDKIVSKLSSSCLQVVSKLCPNFVQVVFKLSPSCLQIFSKLSRSCFLVVSSGWGAVVGFEGGSLRAGLWPRAGSSDHATLNIPSSWILCSANLAIPSCPPWVVSTIPSSWVLYPITSLRYSALLPYSPHSCSPFNYSDLLLPTW